MSGFVYIGSWFHAGRWPSGLCDPGSPRQRISPGVIRVARGGRFRVDALYVDATGMPRPSAIPAAASGVPALVVHARRRRAHGHRRVLGPGPYPSWRRRPVVAELLQHRRLRGAGKRLADVVAKNPTIARGPSSSTTRSDCWWRDGSPPQYPRGGVSDCPFTGCSTRAEKVPKRFRGAERD